MSDVPEQVSTPAVPLTRRERRAEAERASRARRVTRPRPVRSPVGRPLPIVGTLAFAGLVALTGYASTQFVAVAVALAGLVLAWGWPVLLSLPSPRGTTAVLTLGTVSMAVAAVLTRTEPFLSWIPAGMAVAVIAAFLHQLMRRDGRPRLTESIAATVSGLALISSGIALAPLPHILDGGHALAAAMAGLGVGALADPLVFMPRLRRWALFITMVIGGAAAMAVSVVAGHPKAFPGALLGLLTAAVAHAARRVMGALPSTAQHRAQLAIAAAASLSVGVVIYSIVRMPWIFA